MCRVPRREERGPWLAAAVLLIPLLVAPALADDTGNPVPPGSAGMRVYKDPATGRPVAPPKNAPVETPERPSAKSATPAALVPVQGPAGGYKLATPFTFDMDVHESADGRKRAGCTP